MRNHVKYGVINLLIMALIITVLGSVGGKTEEVQAATRKTDVKKPSDQNTFI